MKITEFKVEEQAVLNELADNINHAFVTGAGGFLGQVICRRLLAVGIKVTGFARSLYPELEQLGVTMIQGDLANKSAVISAMKNCDMVFHVASKAGVWGSKASYFEPNVNGTENIVAGCQQHEIKYLIYTSTPSVTFAGIDESGIDESAPYATKFMNHYGHSKAVAEQYILESNSESLKTVALRPHLIWGPNDPHLIPRVLERAKSGRLKLVGHTDKLVDTIYVDNAAYGHLLAALDLTLNEPKSQGKAYFLSNDEPITMAEMLNKILATEHLPKVTSRVPTVVAYAVGGMLEVAYKLLNKQQEPLMTRFVAKQLSCSHYYDISAAKGDFGYKALVSIDEGMKRIN
ncbi:NAD-dependent epimerase/dehydratase family protein [Parashewanella spongiae]|uniref:NAD-dependent epimerase/dehydratase family protein n=1 Tax=Parashewanella spongiae TaxID=342950 RepID=A0A3A6U1V3_9GAMM|nr:2-alkyl-3-oxoalkanoate reductase [Parashewanella spongiae]MCL1079987.1 NAD-dependent epimerase/dehydratase family protein [Parashewanella spongiae]RJY19408.1 NAD-dependent epimerase/dehydratase family protein [Parashewanella spongiae]